MLFQPVRQNVPVEIKPKTVLTVEICKESLLPLPEPPASFEVVYQKTQQINGIFFFPSSPDVKIDCLLVEAVNPDTIIEVLRFSLLYHTLFAQFSNIEGQILYVHDLDGKLLFLSGDFLGFNRHDDLGLNLFDLFEPYSATQVREEMVRIRRNEKPFFENRPIPIFITDKEGRKRVLEVLFFRYYLADIASPFILGFARMEPTLAEQQLLKALSYSGFIYYHSTEEGTTLNATENEEKLLGRPTRGINRADLYWEPSDRKDLLIKLEEKKGIVHDYKCLFKQLDKAGHEHPLVVETTSYWPKNDKKLGVGGIYQNITPSLEDREDGIVILRDNKIFFVNSSFAEIAGLPKDRLQNRLFWEACSKNDEPKLKKLSKSSEKQTNVEIRLREKRESDGRYPRLRLTIEPFNPGEKRIRLLTCQDVTMEVSYDELVSQSQEGIYILEGEYFTFVNQKFAELAGYDSPEDIANKIPWRKMVSSDDLPRIENYVRDFEKFGKAVTQYDFHCMRKDGSQILVETVVERKRTDEGGITVIGSIREIGYREAIREIDRKINNIPAMIEEYLTAVNKELPALCSALLFLDRISKPADLIFKACMPKLLKNGKNYIAPIPLSKVMKLRDIVLANRYDSLNLSQIKTLVGDFLSIPEKGLEAIVLPMKDRQNRIVAVTVSVIEEKDFLKRVDPTGILFLVEQMSFALQNAIAFRKTSITEQLMSSQGILSSVDQLKERVYQTMLDNLTGKETFLYIVDRDGKYRQQAKEPDSQSTTSAPAFAIGEGLIGHVVRAKHVIILQGSSRPPESPLLKLPIGISSWAGVPIQGAGGINDIIGVIEIRDNRNSIHQELTVPFCSMDLGFITHLSQVGGSLLNAALYANRKKEETMVTLHEVKSPSSAIYKAALNLKNKFNIKDEDEKQYREFNTIITEAENLMGLDDVLDVLANRETTINQSSVKIGGDVIMACWHRLKSRFQSLNFNWRNVVVRGYTDIPNLWLDVNKFRRVFYNLFDNSMKYTYAARMKMKIEIDCKIESNQLVIDYSDYGPGIEESIKEQIFKTTYRGEATCKLVKGMGYGLAIAKRIVEAHNGKMYVKNCRNPFTITIELPASLFNGYYPEENDEQGQ